LYFQFSNGVLRGLIRKTNFSQISVFCHFKKLFIIENTLKIIVLSLFKAKIYCNL